MQIEFTPVEIEIEALFSQGPETAVDKELFKWLMFSLTGKGRTITVLSPVDLEDFKSRLTALVELIYTGQKKLRHHN